MELYLVSFVVVLVMGTLVSFLGERFQIPSVFLLVFMGMLLSKTVAFPKEFIYVISTITLVIVAFEASASFSINELKKYGTHTVFLSMVFLVLVLGLLTLAVSKMYAVPVLVGLLFSSLVYGTDPLVVLELFRGKRRKLFKIMELESLFNTPLTIILVLFFLGLVTGEVVVGSAGLTLAAKIIIGLMMGVAGGGLLRVLVKEVKDHHLLNLMVVGVALASYVLADAFGGSGILAVVILGFVFSKAKTARVELKRSSSLLTDTLHIMVFFLLGTVLIINPTYMLGGLLLFGIYLLIRGFAVVLSMPHSTVREKLLLTLHVPKGLDVAVLMLLISSEHNFVQGMPVVINLGLMFVLLSLIVSTVAAHFITLPRA